MTPARARTPAGAASSIDDRGYGHVDALASPARIAGELGDRVRGLRARCPGSAAGPDGRLTRAGEVFGAAGQALGRGVAAMLNVANPVSLLLLLPPALASPAEGSNAAEYTRAVERALDRDCFSSAAADARAGRPTLLTESTGPYPFTGAQAAAVCVLDSFLAYTRGEDTESLADTSQARTA